MNLKIILCSTCFIILYLILLTESCPDAVKGSELASDEISSATFVAKPHKDDDAVKGSEISSDEISSAKFVTAKPHEDDDAVKGSEISSDEIASAKFVAKPHESGEFYSDHTCNKNLCIKKYIKLVGEFHSDYANYIKFYIAKFSELAAIWKRIAEYIYFEHIKKCFVYRLLLDILIFQLLRITCQEFLGLIMRLFHDRKRGTTVSLGDRDENNEDIISTEKEIQNQLVSNELEDRDILLNNKQYEMNGEFASSNLFHDIFKDVRDPTEAVFVCEEISPMFTEGIMLHELINEDVVPTHESLLYFDKETERIYEKKMQNEIRMSHAITEQTAEDEDDAIKFLNADKTSENKTQEIIIDRGQTSLLYFNEQTERLYEKKIQSEIRMLKAITEQAAVGENDAVKFLNADKTCGNETQEVMIDRGQTNNPALFEEKDMKSGSGYRDDGIKILVPHETGEYHSQEVINNSARRQKNADVSFRYTDMKSRYNYKDFGIKHLEVFEAGKSDPQENIAIRRQHDDSVSIENTYKSTHCDEYMQEYSDIAHQSAKEEESGISLSQNISEAKPITTSDADVRNDKNDYISLTSSFHVTNDFEVDEDSSVPTDHMVLRNSYSAVIHREDFTDEIETAENTDGVKEFYDNVDCLNKNVDFISMTNSFHVTNDSVADEDSGVPTDHIVPSNNYSAEFYGDYFTVEIEAAEDVIGFYDGIDFLNKDEDFASVQSSSSKKDLESSTLTWDVDTEYEKVSESSLATK